MPSNNLVCINLGFEKRKHAAAKQQAIENERNRVRSFFIRLRAKNLPAIVRDQNGDWDWEWITETIRHFIDWDYVDAVSRGNVSLGPWNGRAA